MLRCGQIDPGTAPIASNSSNSSAVRMLVSWRQAHRNIATGPSVGSVTSLSSGRVSIRPWVIPSASRSQKASSSQPRPKLVDQASLHRGGHNLPQTGHEQEPDDQQERAAGDLDATVMLP